MERLHHLQVLGRWIVVGVAWATILPVSLWLLRRDISLLRAFFTWAAVRYALIFHPVVTIALSLCIGLTVGVLIWQSRNILFGLPESELKRLQRQVVNIRERGDRHPLWRWVCK
ncbi:hypothetical protein H6G02_12745 [Leptolyngbya sp. FACHB-16]|nr:hypothetical protein [Leptolyngbya sp. FACHB-8]MBD2155382.1 hypothetical protein [Leptolyngbya sp. FACHB-16]